MASKLCCASEQEGRADSPSLPNARLRPATPADRPLLLHPMGSPNSCFTSTCSEDLLEIRDLFHHAQDHAERRPPPVHAPRTRFSHPSLYSLRSLHRITSMRSVIQRKFSKEHSRKELVSPLNHRRAKTKSSKLVHATLGQATSKDCSQRFQITKAELRSDLLSDKKPSDGGYDADAEIVDDMAKNFGKKMIGERPSVHSIDWTTSTSSKPKSETPAQVCKDFEADPQIQPYHIHEHQLMPFSPCVGHILSTPNIRQETCGERDRTLRRSYSAASVVLPKHSPVSPLKLPSLASFEQIGLAWRDLVHEEDCHFSTSAISPPHAKVPESILLTSHDPVSGMHESPSWERATPLRASRVSENHSATSNKAMKIYIQQYRPLSAPDISLSAGDALFDAEHSIRRIQTSERGGNDEEIDSRRSVHLYSMRISHHLRSGSLLSWNNVVEASDSSKASCLFKERPVSEQNSSLCRQRQLSRHERHASSSGFTSSKVPSKWGRVLPTDGDLRADFASSIYSSRPQSPMDNIRGSRMNLSRTSDYHTALRFSSSNSEQILKASEDARKAPQQHVIEDYVVTKSSRKSDIQPALPALVGRKNSVAKTKRSKFREEFDSSPFRNKSTSASSIMKYLGLKRLSMRSQSETNLRFDTMKTTTDGQFEQFPVAFDRERHQSRSMMSLQNEQKALGKGKGVDRVWDHALKAHQEEKASLFLLKNRDLAMQGSLFRERSGSTTVKSGHIGGQDCTRRLAGTGERASIGSSSNLSSKPDPSPSSRVRRDAFTSPYISKSDQDLSYVFEKQGDGPKVVGAWGRYPSHTRSGRNSTADISNFVDTRDFALEAAINLTSNAAHDGEDDLIDPTERPPVPAQKKKKKMKSSSRIATSNSMTFGKTFLKNYSKIFKTQSAEFRKHGRGHRSSIATGGRLEFPELELLPDVWTKSSLAEGKPDQLGHRADFEIQHGSPPRDSRLHSRDSVETLRLRRTSSVPNLDDIVFHDGTKDLNVTRYGARAWSIYYEKCARSSPYADPEADPGCEKFAKPVFNDPRMFLHSRTSKHSRNFSQLSGASEGNSAANLPSWNLLRGPEGAEDTSLASVRRSTIDLISQFKAQEVAEHDKVLALTRAEL